MATATKEASAEHAQALEKHGKAMSPAALKGTEMVAGAMVTTSNEGRMAAAMTNISSAMGKSGAAMAMQAWLQYCQATGTDPRDADARSAVGL